MDVEARLQHLERKLVLLQRRDRRWWCAAVVAVGVALACKAADDKPIDYLRKGEPIVVGKTTIGEDFVAISDGSGFARLGSRGLSITGVGSDDARATLSSRTLSMRDHDAALEVAVGSSGATLDLGIGRVSSLELAVDPAAATATASHLARTAVLRADATPVVAPATAPSTPSAHPPARNDVIEIPELR